MNVRIAHRSRPRMTFIYTGVDRLMMDDEWILVTFLQGSKALVGRSERPCEVQRTGYRVEIDNDGADP